MKKKLVLPMIMMVSVLLVFAGGKSEVKQEAQTGNSDKTLVFIPKTTSSQFWVNIYNGAKDAAKELGYREVKFQGPPSGADVTTQINIFSDVITSKPAGVMIAVTDQKSLKKPIEDAIKAGSVVITVNSGINSELIKTHVATDNYQAGSMAADVLADLIDQKGVVIDIGVDPTSETGRERENGFRDRVKEKYPQIHVLPVQFSYGDVAKAMNITSDLLTGNPDVVGIYAAQDAGGTGAAQVLKQRGLKGKVKLVAFDSSPDEFSLFLEDYIDALVVQDPYGQGYMGVYALDKILSNSSEISKFIETPVKIISKQNLRNKDIYGLLITDANIKKILEKAGIYAK